MKRVLLGLAMVFSLGCSGVSEALLESMTGGDVQIGSDGSFEMRMPNGVHVKTVPNGELPDDFPMPAPWDGAETESVVFTTDEEGVTSTLATYTLQRPREQVIERYTTWADAEGLGTAHHDKQKNAGTSNETWVWKSDDGPLIFSISEAFGQSSVTVGSTPLGNLKSEVDSL